jgi:osmoprotectant transport system permease protein
MDFLGQVVAWFVAPEQWNGQDSIPVHLLGHLTLSVFALLAAILVALPIGIAIGHTGRGAFFAIALANIGRAIPSIAILGIVFPISLRLNLGFGFVPT